MTGYMAYSLCLGIPPDTDSMDAIDPTAIAAMRDRFSATHTQLQHVHFSTVRLSSSRTFLNVVVNGPLAAVQAARADILRQNPVEVRESYTQKERGWGGEREREREQEQSRNNTF